MHDNSFLVCDLNRTPNCYGKTWLEWIGQRQLQDETRNIYVLGFGAFYIKGLTVCYSFSRNLYFEVRKVVRYIENDLSDDSKHNKNDKDNKNNCVCLTDLSGSSHLQWWVTLSCRTSIIVFSIVRFQLVKGHSNSSWPEFVSQVSPGYKKNRGFVTHLWVTGEMRDVCSDATMRHWAEICWRTDCKIIMNK